MKLTLLFLSQNNPTYYFLTSSWTLLHSKTSQDRKWIFCNSAFIIRIYQYVFGSIGLFSEHLNFFRIVPHSNFLFILVFQTICVFNQTAFIKVHKNNFSTVKHSYQIIKKILSGFTCYGFFLSNSNKKSTDRKYPLDL